MATCKRAPVVSPSTTEDQHQNFSATVRIPPKVLRSLHWWHSTAMTKGSLFKEPAQLTITSDASLFGWGTHLHNQVAQGRWSPGELLHSINWLLLRAVHLALCCFCRKIQHQHVLVLMDNVAAKANINRQGGTRSRSLVVEAETLGRWAE